jgi:hypothetical protein
MEPNTHPKFLRRASPVVVVSHSNEYYMKRFDSAYLLLSFFINFFGTADWLIERRIS